MNKRNEGAQRGYDEYARQPVRRYTDPQDATPADIPDWLANGAAPKVIARALDTLAPAKPHLQLRVKLGKYTKLPLWTVTNKGEAPTVLSSWVHDSAKAIERATHRSRLG